MGAEVAGGEVGWGPRLGSEVRLEGDVEDGLWFREDLRGSRVGLMGVANLWMNGPAPRFLCQGESLSQLSRETMLMVVRADSTNPLSNLDTFWFVDLVSNTPLVVMGDLPRDLSWEDATGRFMSAQEKKARDSSPPYSHPHPFSSLLRGSSMDRCWEPIRLTFLGTMCRIIRGVADPPKQSSGSGSNAHSRCWAYWLCQFKCWNLLI
jgi:hypothetical protein